MLKTVKYLPFKKKLVEMPGILVVFLVSPLQAGVINVSGQSQGQR